MMKHIEYLTRGTLAVLMGCVHAFAAGFFFGMEDTSGAVIQALAAGFWACLFLYYYTKARHHAER